MEDIEKQGFQKNESVEKIIPDEKVPVVMGNYVAYLSPETAKGVQEGLLPFLKEVIEAKE